MPSIFVYLLDQVASSVKPMLEVLEITNDAWNSVTVHTFQAAWMVTGYFDSEHFNDAMSDGQPVKSLEMAESILDPCGVLQGSSINGTPQFCPRMQWQIKDRFSEVVYCTWNRSSFSLRIFYPGKLKWNPRIVFHWVVCRFYVNFTGCSTSFLENFHQQEIPKRTPSFLTWNLEVCQVLSNK